ncbi:hypothetical protein AAGR22_02825 [Erwinia sp. HDF1-3R]|uniref:hypothetical protein n=1 Tax=Erwinia sp. HDF1-3R TaxID=3141543 RepID=UPI0031F5C5F3
MGSGDRQSDTLPVGRPVVQAAIPAIPVDNPSVCRASQLQALPGAFGSDSRPDGPVASGRPARRSLSAASLLPSPGPPSAPQRCG